jgi:hypothetical protein
MLLLKHLFFLCHDNCQSHQLIKILLRDSFKLWKLLGCSPEGWCKFNALLQIYRRYLSNGMREFLVRGTWAEKKRVQDLCLLINIIDDKYKMAAWDFKPKIIAKVPKSSTLTTLHLLTKGRLVGVFIMLWNYTF